MPSFLWLSLSQHTYFVPHYFCCYHRHYIFKHVENMIYTCSLTTSHLRLFNVSQIFLSHSSLTSFLSNISAVTTCLLNSAPPHALCTSIYLFLSLLTQQNKLILQTTLSPPLYLTHSFLASHPQLHNQLCSFVHHSHPFLFICACGSTCAEKKYSPRTTPFWHICLQDVYCYYLHLLHPSSLLLQLSHYYQLFHSCHYLTLSYSPFKPLHTFIHSHHSKTSLALHFLSHFFHSLVH